MRIKNNKLSERQLAIIRVKKILTQKIKEYEKQDKIAEVDACLSIIKILDK